MNMTARKRRGRPSGDHGKHQRDVAHTLLKVIGERGFEKASMRAVARKANCTTGVLSHYFSSKEDLICHAIHLLFDWADRGTAAAAEHGDSLKALQLVLDIAGETEQPPFDFWAVWLQVLARAKHNRRLTQIISKRHGQFRDLLTRIIREGQEAKQLRSDIAADLLADHINAVTDGLGLMAPLETQRLTKERRDALAKLTLMFVRRDSATEWNHER